MKKLVKLCVFIIAVYSCSDSDNNNEYQYNPKDGGFILDLNVSSWDSNDFHKLNFDLYKTKEDLFNKQNKIVSTTIVEKNQKIEAGVIELDKEYYMDVYSDDREYDNWRPDRISFKTQPLYYNNNPKQIVSVKVGESLKNKMIGKFNFYNDLTYDIQMAYPLRTIIPKSITIKEDFSIIIIDEVIEGEGAGTELVHKTELLAGFEYESVLNWPAHPFSRVMDSEGKIIVDRAHYYMLHYILEVNE